MWQQQQQQQGWQVQSAFAGNTWQEQSPWGASPQAGCQQPTYPAAWPNEPHAAHAGADFGIGAFGTPPQVYGMSAQQPHSQIAPPPVKQEQRWPAYAEGNDWQDLNSDFHQ
eukprot:5819975-Amphidinium_carterae.1